MLKKTACLLSLCLLPAFAHAELTKNDLMARMASSLYTTGVRIENLKQECREVFEIMPVATDNFEEKAQDLIRNNTNTLVYSMFERHRELLRDRANQNSWLNSDYLPYFQGTTDRCVGIIYTLTYSFHVTQNILKEEM